MKKCNSCGQECPDEANTCAQDGWALVVVPERIASPPPIPWTPGTGRKKYRTYKEVPWYRREPGFVALIFALFCTPVVLALCLICLTGDVYRNDYDKDGNLKV